MHQVISCDWSDDVNGNPNDIASPFTSSGSTDRNEADESRSISSAHLSRSALSTGSPWGSGREGTPKAKTGNVGSIKTDDIKSANEANTIRRAAQATPSSPKIGTARRPTSASSFLSSLLWDTSVGCQSEAQKQQLLETQQQQKEPVDSKEADNAQAAAEVDYRPVGFHPKTSPGNITAGDENNEVDGGDYQDQELVGMAPTEAALIKLEHIESLRRYLPSSRPVVASDLHLPKCPWRQVKSMRKLDPASRSRLKKPRQNTKKSKAKENDKKQKDKKGSRSGKVKTKSKSKTKCEDTEGAKPKDSETEKKTTKSNERNKTRTDETGREAGRAVGGVRLTMR